MKRVLIVAGLVLLAAAGLLEAQSTGPNDQETQRFVLPGTNTTGWRVHASRAHMSLALPRGNIIAAGGYKVAFAYAHGGNVVVNSTNVAMPILGTASQVSAISPGVLYQRVPYEGSIMAISIGASAALTAGTVTAEATIRRPDGTVYPSGLTAALTTGDQFATNTQARGRSVFTDLEGVGCRLTATSAVTPVTAEVLCTVIVEL